MIYTNYATMTVIGYVTLHQVEVVEAANHPVSNANWLESGKSAYNHTIPNPLQATINLLWDMSQLGSDMIPRVVSNNKQIYKIIQGPKRTLVDGSFDTIGGNA